ncbi:MAG: type II toxin-antitoxin system prevent-host-death family antitoxin [Frankiaceae bacterium]|nr:type II toxin-antitoxin system prevent-host-death family antitoxin [Frankiaceae bacterium]
MVVVPVITGTEFNRRPSQVKRAAETEPVVITEHGVPSFVLMTYAQHEQLRQAPPNMADWLEMKDAEPEDDDIEFGPVGSWVEAAQL